mmetsp:Transcript_14981/g.32150  ORF Transcript_14981/g.32150 Transcript_14981/m.32150 type:complete len:470 (+) Transcript_14981:445-1854(+)
MCSNVDAGKSTLAGCLSRGILDDGRGHARSYVLKHIHEQKRGQTSSISQCLLGYNKEGQVLPPTAGPEQARKCRRKDLYEVATKALFRVTLVDLCGHEKYLKSSIHGLTSLSPDCAMVVIGAERGIQRMTREHIGLCCALRIPFFIVLTKIDMAPEQILKETQFKIKRILKRAGRKCYYVREGGEVEGAVKCMDTDHISFTPVFEVSSVVGTNMDNLREFVRSFALKKTDSSLKGSNEGKNNNNCEAKEGLDEAAIVTPMDQLTLSDQKHPNTSVNFAIDDIFNVPGVGIVLGGAVLRGEVHVGQKVYVGPDGFGHYRAVVVRSMHRLCVPSTKAFSGQAATLAVKNVGKEKLTKDMFRKAMMIVGEPDIEEARKNTVREFEAEVKVLHHSTTIDCGYTPVVHSKNVRQAARIMKILTIDGNENTLARTGSEVLIRFRFKRPEYIEVGRPLIFREGTAKGCGKIVRLIK